MKFLIFDAGPIISLSMAGHLQIIEKLKNGFDGHFILTPQVKQEVIDRPMKVSKYRLEAIKVQDLLDRGVLELSSKFVSTNRLDKETARILKSSNGVFRSKRSNEKMKIIHEGEASCLAFARLCGCKSVIVVDERTTRLLSESPKNLRRLIEKKLHQGLQFEPSLLKDLGNFSFIRSTELMFVAFKKGLVPLKKNRRVLEALLYSLKFKGAAISSKEIETMKNLNFK